ncbi:MAG: hypothetical protein HY901_34775 [Deltaproteobacteria bacterium]|nr:hypothetical protein [Deltaproteobacteria bacterium]
MALPEVACGKYMPGTGRSCLHYLPGGPCNRPDEFMCVEWLRANGFLCDPVPDALEHLRQLRTIAPPPAPSKPLPIQIGLFPRLRPQRSR